MEVVSLKGKCRNAEKVEGCIPDAQGTHLGDGKSSSLLGKDFCDKEIFN